MRSIVFLTLLAIAVPSLAQTSATAIRVKIEATELDKKLLFDKLNEHGPGHRMKFELADENFEYRIAFNTFQHRNTAATLAGAGAVHFSGAEVKVYDKQDKTLFSFTRETRYTDKGATNAAAKEIIKRLLQLRAPAPK